VLFVTNATGHGELTGQPGGVGRLRVVALSWMLVPFLAALIVPSRALAQEDLTPRSGSQAASSTESQASDSFKLPIFVNNAVAYIFGPDHRTPFVATAFQPRGADIARSTLEFAHVDAWRYGHNLADISVRQSNAVEPAAAGGSGATEFYAIFRSGISTNRVAGRPVIRFGALRDIDIQAGADLQTKNSSFAPNERTLYLGPRFLFIVADGFINVGLHLRKEWNHNGFLERSENYDTDFNIEPTWSFPFRIGRARFVFDGFADFNTAKGKDASGQPTRAELLVRPQLKFDLGNALGRPARRVEVGVGVERWHNMFGKAGSSVPGANQATVILSLVVHWGGRRAADTDARSQLR
jgi:hypothetical protein